MSLDISLYVETPVSRKGTGVFIRDNGQNRELTIDEVKEKFPNANISEDEYDTNCVYEANITHNLNNMADRAGIYEAVWRPYQLHSKYNTSEDDYHAEMLFERSIEIKAKDIIEILEKGLNDLKSRPEYFKKFNPSNGWGTYEQLVSFVENYLEACKEYPDAIIEVDR